MAHQQAEDAANGTVNREVGVLLTMLRLAFERSRDDLIHELGSQLILDWGADPFGNQPSPGNNDVQCSPDWDDKSEPGGLGPDLPGLAADQAIGVSPYRTQPRCIVPGPGLVQRNLPLPCCR